MSQYTFDKDINISEEEKKNIIDYIEQFENSRVPFVWHNTTIKMDPNIIALAQRYELDFKNMLKTTLNSVSPKGDIKEACRNLMKKYSIYDEEEEEIISTADDNHLEQYFSSAVCVAMQTVVCKACIEKEAENNNERE